MTQSETITIAPRFCGPNGSGNGGYVAGVLANCLGDGAAEITLRARVPLEVPLSIVRDDDHSLRLMHGEQLVCEARRTTLALDVPRPPFDWALAERLRASGGSVEETEFCKCIVCGRERGEGDGLQVWGGRAPGQRSLCLYLPHANHAGDDGRIRPEFIWGTLDCPGAWAAQDEGATQPALTGRMTGEIFYRPRPGERCLVVGWAMGAEGRKLHSGTALYTESGILCAAAQQLWIVLKPPAT